MPLHTKWDTTVSYPENNTVNNTENEDAIKEIILPIEGMTCDACQNHVDHSVLEVDGVGSVPCPPVQEHG